MASPRLNKNVLDTSQVFLTFVALVGDVEKTAAALDLDPAVVRKLADDEGWDVKIQRVCFMSKSGKPGDWERAQHRALCWVQAHRVRGLLDRMVERFEGMDEDEIAEAVSSVAKDGSRHVSARFFADLTAAMEKAHQMGYTALGDTTGERKDRQTEEGDTLNANALHAAVISALNNPAVKTIDVTAEVRKAGEEKALSLSTQDGQREPLSENGGRNGAGIVPEVSKSDQGGQNETA